jgi:DNA-binding protein YbaB
VVVDQVPKQIDDIQRMMKEHDALRTQLANIEKRLHTSSKEINDKKELVTVQVNLFPSIIPPLY